MYETGTVVDVHAFHVMPDSPPPENERHAHDYRIEVVVEGPDVDEAGMLVDLDVLDGALREVRAAVSEADLETIGAEEPVTVERFARWVHGQLGGKLGTLPTTTLRVRVWESPTAFGGYAAVLG